jgi:hypothetical protein
VTGTVSSFRRMGTVAHLLFVLDGCQSFYISIRSASVSTAAIFAPVSHNAYFTQVGPPFHVMPVQRFTHCGPASDTGRRTLCGFSVLWSMGLGIGVSVDFWVGTQNRPHESAQERRSPTRPYLNRSLFELTSVHERFALLPTGCAIRCCLRMDSP